MGGYSGKYHNATILTYFACEKPVHMQTVFSGAVLVLHSIIVTPDGRLVLYIWARCYKTHVHTYISTPREHQATGGLGCALG